MKRTMAAIIFFLSLISIYGFGRPKIIEEAKVYENKYFHIRIKNPNPDWAISTYPDKKRNALSIRIGKKKHYCDGAPIVLNCQKAKFENLEEYVKDIESKINRFEPTSVSKSDVNIDSVTGVKISSSFKYGTNIGLYWLYKGFQYDIIASGENIDYLNKVLDTIKIIE